MSAVGPERAASHVESKGYPVWSCARWFVEASGGPSSWLGPLGQRAGAAGAAGEGRGGRELDRPRAVNVGMIRTLSSTEFFFPKI